MFELHILFWTTNCLLERTQFTEMRAFFPNLFTYFTLFPYLYLFLLGI